MTTEPVSDLSQPDDQALMAQADYHEEQSRRQSTPMDAKNKAISDLTAACYQKASQLQLTKEEIAALSADFPDEAFQPGAAGKENLIYIEHAALRERLDQVIGMGQWCVIPVRRWEEPFIYQKEEWINNRRTGKTYDVKGSHVYVDGIMLIRGAFVGSAIGEMTYYPDNHTQNYGDAVEGAETAAMRRCCKRLGIGLQAWRKDWCNGWWIRKNEKKLVHPRQSTPPQKRAYYEEGTSESFKEVGPPSDTTQPVKTAPAPQSEAPKATPEPHIGPKYRLKTLNRLQAAPGQDQRNLVCDWLVSQKWIVGTQTPEDWPLDKLPKTAEEFLIMGESIKQFERSRREEVPQ